ncbi:MAG: HPr family phosphocarrier protein [Endomicrobiia bacterium]
MIEEEFTVNDELGLHIRPVSRLISVTSKYKSDIKIIKGNQIADAKSVLEVLALVITCGDKIKVIVDGEDEKEAMVDIKEFFKSI